MTMTTPPRASHILVVDDDRVLLSTLERLLRREGFEVTACGDPESALEQVREQAPHLVVSDLMMPGLDGIELLRRVRGIAPETEVLLITGHATVELAVEAMRQGAYDFIQKPVERDQLLRVVERALDKQALSSENRRLRDRLAELDSPSRMIGASPSMTELKRMVAHVAPSDLPVLITGESGTGKEMVADLLHGLSRRSAGRAIKISCAAIPENLLESELFGYERGAFSGAAASKPGRFELADGGTLFLDEIGEMSGAMQAKLLRVLQDGCLQRLGSTRDVHFDARLVCATNLNIAQAIHEKKFREDLYHRINVIEIEVPPLRDRVEDIPLLTAHFLKVHAAPLGLPPRSISPEAVEMLSHYPWPGNVRELENVVQRAAVMAQGPVLRAEDLRFSAARKSPQAGPSSEGLHIPPGTPLSEVEELLIEDALRRSGGDKERAARLLGVSARTLYRRVRRPGPQDLPTI